MFVKELALPIEVEMLIHCAVLRITSIWRSTLTPMLLRVGQRIKSGSLLTATWRSTLTPLHLFCEQ